MLYDLLSFMSHNRAIRLRKCLGGAMRQTGYLAAACLHALSEAEANIKKDHENARRLAVGINNEASNIVKADVESLQTNIILVKIVKEDLSVPALVERLAKVNTSHNNNKNDLNYVSYFNWLFF